MAGENWIIYKKAGCGWCDRALDLLLSCGASVEIRGLGEIRHMEFAKEKGWKTAPQVYHGGVHVGGYADLVEYLGFG